MNVTERIAYIVACLLIALFGWEGIKRAYQLSVAIFALLLASTSAHAQSLEVFCQRECPPCRLLEPKLAALSAQGHRVVIHPDADAALWKQNGVTASPTTIARDASGKEVYRASGNLSAGDLKQIVDSIESRPAQPAPKAGWFFITAPRQVDATRLGKTLADIEGQMPTAGHDYTNQGDLDNWAHETTHGVNSRIRQHFPGSNAFYVTGGWAMVLREPRCKLSDVAAAVPGNLRGSGYQLNLVTKQFGAFNWNDQPLSILDEWVAYTNGAMTVKEMKLGEWFPLATSIEFIDYAGVLIATVDRLDPNYVDKAWLKYFVQYNASRVQKLAEQTGQAAGVLSACQRWGLDPAKGAAK